MKSLKEYLIEAVTEYDERHRIAQHNAAKPIEHGGLGLHKDNTALERAKAMGFDIDAKYYHGTSSDFNEFKGDTAATYVTDDHDYASTFKNTVNNVIPLMAKTTGVKELKNGLNHFNVGSYLNSKEYIFSDVDAMKGIDAGSTSNSLALVSPKQLRSRFAAFDPMKKESGDLLS